jgi:SAM-dependent methyltransferase
MPKRRQNVLELCTGTARAAIPLAQAGHRVVGVDVDGDMLKIAQRKRDSVGLAEKELDLRRGDVLKFKIDQTFDWAVLLFNTLLSFPTLKDQDALLQNVHRHLKPGGRFWVDIFNPDLTILAEPHHAHFDSATFYVPALNRSVHRHTEICRAKMAPQLQEVTFHYAWADEQGEIHKEKNSFAMTWMFPRELILLLERNGFAIEAMHGDYDGSPVTTLSPRIIVCAKKR